MKALPKQNHDTSVICDTSKLTDKGCDGAPDWIIEIVLPGSRRMDYYIIIEIVSPGNPSDDYIRKLYYYKNYGVREYWIVDPAKNFVIVYNFDTSDSGQYTFADTIKAGIYEDLYVDFSKINL